MLAGYTRLTYSLVVIMLETTSSINIFIPMMISVIFGRAVGSLLSPSLYGRATRLKQMPFLLETSPAASKLLEARNFMVRDVLCLGSIADMPSLKEAI